MFKIQETEKTGGQREKEMMREQLSPKVKALYEAVMELAGENVDMRNVKVSDITNRAGIGKGTAYEYFSNKEEIISSALLYHIDLICSQIVEDISGMDDFSSMLRYLFQCMDREIKKRDCLAQFIQLVTDNSPVGIVLQKKIREKNSEICMPLDVVGYIIQAGRKQGMIKAKLPAFYMNMALMAKLLMYAIYIAEERAGNEEGREQMHRLLCEGLLKELN